MTMTYPFPVSGDEFKGKRVLVTGGTKGMGQAMVRRFALSGASVATTARSPLPDGQAVALFVQTDIGTAAGVQAVITRIQQEWTGLDILVNNVGGSDAPNGGYKALSDDDWQKALNVNLLASVRLDRAFLPGMIEPSQVSFFTSRPSSTVCRYMTRRLLMLRRKVLSIPTIRAWQTKLARRAFAST